MTPQEAFELFEPVLREAVSDQDTHDAYIVLWDAIFDPIDKERDGEN